MIKIVGLLYEVLAFIRTLASRIEYLKANKDRATLDENPAMWFSNKFSGMPTDKPQSKTDKADT